MDRFEPASILVVLAEGALGLALLSVAILLWGLRSNRQIRLTGPKRAVIGTLLGALSLVPLGAAAADVTDRAGVQSRVNAAVEQSRKTTLAAPSVVTGHVEAFVGRQRSNYQVAIVRSGKDRDIRFTGPEGGVIQFRRISGHYFFHFNRAGLRSYLRPADRKYAGEILNYVDGRWLELSGKQRLPALASLGNDRYLESVLGSGSATRQGRDRVAGVTCLLVEGSATPPMCLDVDRKRILRIADDRLPLGGELTFRYSKVKAPQAPTRKVPWNDVLAEE